MRRFTLLLLLSTSILHAQNGNNNKHKNTTPPIPAEKIPPSPFLTAEQSMLTFKVDKDFEVDLVASDGTVDMPVAMKFDADGSLWVAELVGYMLDLDGTDEDKPMGRIVVLQDTDANGQIDKRTVFLDKILLPRALAIYEDGLLYADEHKLYFTKREGLTAGTTTVVDPEYAKGGNVEHKPNGLMRGIDNWLYNAKCSYRYRRQGKTDKWTKEVTNFRGQWGIAQDNYGRLFHNNNSILAVGEFFPPNLLRANKNLSLKKIRLTDKLGENLIYPIRMNPGVNRAYMSKKNGYKSDIIDPITGKLPKPTAASGLEFYRGNQFPAEYQNTLFITAPCGNLVSALKVSEKGSSLVAEPVFDKKEIWASKDERFRPVAITNAPDGTLYIADFSHGIIQHKTYLTSYLRAQYESRELDKPSSGTGRIYRLRHKGNAVKAPLPLHELPTSLLVAALGHENGWTRDTAQRLIIERQAALQKDLALIIIKNKENPVARLHALYTIEGLGLLKANLLLDIIKHDNDEKVVGAALTLIDQIPQAERAALTEVTLAVAETPYLLPHKARALAQIGTQRSLQAALTLLKSQPSARLVREATIAGLENREQEFQTLAASAGYKDKSFDKTIAQAISAATKPVKVPGSHLKGEDLASFKRGKTKYEMICAVCHGFDGAGQPNLGPLLDGSDWVSGRPDRLSRILLHGLTGPITINGKKFTSNLAMPGLVANPLFDDAAIADVMTYIRNSWKNEGKAVKPGFVTKQRAATKARNGSPYTEAQLNTELGK